MNAAVSAKGAQQGSILMSFCPICLPTMNVLFLSSFPLTMYVAIVLVDNEGWIWLSCYGDLHAATEIAALIYSNLYGSYVCPPILLKKFFSDELQ